MTTIINTPRTSTDDSSAAAMIFGTIVILALGVLFYLYVLPQILNAEPTPNNVTEIKVDVPTIQVPAPTPAPTPAP